MDYYITAIRAAADSAEPHDLKPALDFLLELAIQDYQAGALDLLELDDITAEYGSAILTTNAINYI